MITPNETPITQEWGEPSWTRWLAEVGDCIKGVWGNEKTTLVTSGLSAEPACYIAASGQTMTFSLHWSAGVTATSATAKVPLRTLSGDEKFYQFEPGVLHAADSTGLLSSAIASGDTITFVDFSSANAVSCSGTLIIKPLRSEPQS